MIIDQLSIFLNNAVGRITEVTSTLSEAGVNLKAFTLSESSDFGILRIITDNNEKAVEVLKANYFAVNVTKVVYMELGDTPGALYNSIQKVSDAGVSIEYMYAFSTGDAASVVIRTEDIERCNALIEEV
ncbi:MAG: amino acid-binding protein [Bacteroidales bacterium]|jgi:hypothetical protein|nr:amino acid-binding protein [Bacteroidales bacterium]